MPPTFSQRERGPLPRMSEVVTPAVWGGVVAAIQTLVSNGAFGRTFPAICPDGAGVCGTDESTLRMTLQAELPSLEWPLSALRRLEDSWASPEPYGPATPVVLDLLEFTHRSIGKPIEGSFHSFFRHHHLSFDEEAGRTEFRSSMNRLFESNGLAFELTDEGLVRRLLPPVLGESLANTLFRSGDTALDRMLEESRLKFSSPEQGLRREALERLWDCWERVESLDLPRDKAKSTARLLDQAAAEPNFRALLEAEAATLTKIGNQFHIRHTEVGKPEILESAHIDYLYHRLFSLIRLVLGTRQA